MGWAKEVGLHGSPVSLVIRKVQVSKYGYSPEI